MNVPRAVRHATRSADAGSGRDRPLRVPSTRSARAPGGKPTVSVRGRSASTRWARAWVVATAIAALAMAAPKSAFRAVIAST